MRHEVVDEAYASTKTMYQAADMIGQVYGRLKAAARGRLPDDSDLFEPARRQPMLWEIKWKLGRLGEFRMYHAEPGHDPDLVALRFHRKRTTELSAVEIAELQDQEMDLAAERFVAGEPSRWGHGRSCGDCLHP